MTERPKAALLNTIDNLAADELSRAGFAVQRFAGDITSDELRDTISEADVLGIRSVPRIPTELIRSAERLVAIGCYCAGTEHVDMDAATRQDITVFNAAAENGLSVAEYVITQAGNLLRGLPQHNHTMHSGEWYKEAGQSRELAEMTMGIIGHGKIGEKVGRRAVALGMNVLYYDVVEKDAQYGAQATRLDELLAEADVITVHTPGGLGRPVVGEAELAQMRKRPYLINAARGETIDYDAVVCALDDDVLAGAAFDVHPDEPAGKRAIFDSPLLGRPNVLLTPHIAGSTIQSQRRIAEVVTKRLIKRYCDGTDMEAVTVGRLHDSEVLL